MLKSAFSYYLPLLRKLKRASDTRPHFVQELRFLLSLPLVDRPRQRALAQEQAPATVPSTDKDTHPGLGNYLCRPPSELLAVDPSAIFAVCRQDLRLAVERSAATATGSTPNVAATLAALQEAKWLESYLDKILHRDTAEQLAEMIAVSEGSLTDMTRDFIPDDFFDSTAAERSADSSSSSSSGDAAKPAKSSSQRKDLGAQEDQTPPPTFISPHVVFSAGAQGLHREMLNASCTTHNFPLAESFLRSSSCLDKDELRRLGRNHHKELLKYLSDRLPRSVRARNEDMELVACLGDFCAEHARVVGSMTAVAGQRHSYLLSIEITPLNRGHHVQLVHTFFASYTPELMRETNEVGLMPAEAVKRLLQERDWSQEERRKFRGEKATIEGEASPRATVDGAAADVSNEDAGTSPYRCQLYFSSTVETPTVLKGLLYYKVGSGEELLHEPIKTIAFEPLLMMPLSQ